MDTLKDHLPFAGEEDLHELKMIAVRLEETVYTASISQSDYFWKVSCKNLSQIPIFKRPADPESLIGMQIMDQVHSQAQSNSMPMAADQSQQLLWQNIQNYARIHSCPSLSSSDPSVFGQIINTTMNQGDLTVDKTEHDNNDWKEDLYRKIKSMKDKYFSAINDIYQKVNANLQQHGSLQQPLKSEQLEKTMLEQIMAFLQLNKSSTTTGLKEIVGMFEKQIVNFISSNGPRKCVSSLQQLQSQINQVNPQFPPTNVQSPALLCCSRSSYYRKI